jgi:hypothetical protein
MDFLNLLEYFLANQGAWAILFVFLFVYEIRTNQAREKRMVEDHNKQKQDTLKKLTKLQADVSLMLETWKIIIERELERRDKP